ncbi:DNA-binding protein [Burkholderia multivorans]|uniref:DNA-binding protein n=1 Tax=Burkholderia multivorans TaxID=87883 RepID=UPI001C24D271|nr:DNA-binding protein [Burkholderia multivorans]MBU9310836.1 DNA-binding protein [Burkholderia multivorans]MBU9364524.1 DNA-binding protein [Burkholderia multivorans]MCA8456591.1 DNA-binding protein [Burkholderia multivorans]MDN7594575.1 DNA-binding protein [Burkholderia multivorans]MDN7870004.1 DNA-binding protein [Burkholderia multivorans]
MTVQQLAVTQTRRPITTEELAALLSIRPQSIRKRFCQTGAYFSLRPVKLPNGRLMWPADALDKLAEGA